MKPEMWQKVAKFKGAEYFRKALYIGKEPKGETYKGQVIKEVMESR